MKPLDISLLPGTARELVDLIGLASTLHLVDKRGGRALDILHGRSARGRARRDELAVIVGLIAANKIAQRYAGTVLIVPLCTAALRVATYAAIQARFDELIRAGRSARKTVHVLVEEFAPIHESTVWRALKRPTNAVAIAAAKDAAQLDFFGQA